ncbi:unnamed protein product [Caenorhabditis nigoni]
MPSSFRLIGIGPRDEKIERQTVRVKCAFKSRKKIRRRFWGKKLYVRIRCGRKWDWEFIHKHWKILGLINPELIASSEIYVLINE